MNFDELVNLTYAQLFRKKQLDVETVKGILTDVGLPELLSRDTSSNPPRRLWVRQVYIRGHKYIPEQDGDRGIINYHRHLKLGLNGWIASNSTGKSTILKVIAWALSGVEPILKSDVRDWLTDVAVEIEIEGDGIYTIFYTLRQRKSALTGYIYAHELDEVIENTGEIEPISEFADKTSMKETIGRFFGKRLGFTELQIVQLEKESIAPRKVTATWDVYSQALFINGADYSDLFFTTRDSKLTPHYQNTLNLYLGFGLVEAISRLQSQKKEAQRELQLAKEIVKVTSQGVSQQIKDLEAELREVQRQIKGIDAGESATVDPAYADEIRNKVATLNARIIDLENNRQDLLIEEQNIKNKLDLQRRMAHGLRESIKFKVFLSALEVERCPHCENDIPKVPVEEEVASGYCHVCHNPLQPTADTSMQEAQLKEIEKKIKEQRRLLRRVENEIYDIETKIKAIQAERQQYEAEFRDISRQQRENVSTELRNLLSKKGYLEGQLAQLRHRLKENQSQNLKNLKIKIDVLSAAGAILLAKSKRDNAVVLEKLERYTADFAKSLGIPHLEKITLNDKFWMTIKQSHKNNSFSSMETGERLRLKIAFHMALLRLRIENGVGRHPAFLMIDSPGGAEMDERYFDALNKQFLEINRRFRDKMQILVASSRVELLEMFEEDAVEYKEEGDVLF